MYQYIDKTRFFKLYFIIKLLFENILYYAAHDNFWNPVKFKQLRIYEYYLMRQMFLLFWKNRLYTKLGCKIWSNSLFII